MNRENPTAPYPGLRPYHEDEQDKFFGRETDAEVLIDKVLTNRLTLLFAASGVGKSSLLQAAVIPRLKSAAGENLSVVYHIDWVSDPLSSVRAAVLQALHGTLPEGSADEAGETLVELLEFCGLFVRHPLVLILDQFEEFFRYQRAQSGFHPFIEQLTAIITNPQLPVSLVLSMREDFALELNAFKPRLPTILFENFYRLEKLGREGAREAIVTPVEQVGFGYEAALLDKLLNDLLSRELDRQPHSPVVELLETVEPPYLQIVCAQLWELNKADPDKLLRLATYEKAGAAKGILSNYLNGVLQGFTLTEKQLASKAFDHLASQRGVKMAYTAAALAETARVNESTLGKVLDKLAAVRILRTQQREESTWYELYHDMFSASVETWNVQWKESTRILRAIRSAIKFSLIVFLTGTMTYFGYDYYENISNKFLYINPRTDEVEIYRGNPNSFDFFKNHKYIAQTGFSRNQLSIDNRSEKQIINNYQGLLSSLVKLMNTNERIYAYSLIGDYKQVYDFAKKDVPSRTLQGLSGIEYLNKISRKVKIFLITPLRENYLIKHEEKQKVINIKEYYAAFKKATSTSKDDRKLAINYFNELCKVKSNCYFIESPYFLKVILGLINDPDPFVQYDAVRFCINFKVEKMYPELKLILKDNLKDSFRDVQGLPGITK